MGRVIYNLSVSLDGFVETPDRDIAWTAPDDALHRFFNDQARDLGAFIHGRRLFELMAAYWPTADADSSTPAAIADFARIWRGTQKLVFSRTLGEVQHMSRVVRGDLAAEVDKLKREIAGDMHVGGPTLAASFIRLGLVDVFQMVVRPVVLGAGTPYFPPLDHALPLSETREFPGGVVVLRYERV